MYNLSYSNRITLSLSLSLALSLSVSLSLSLSRSKMAWADHTRSFSDCIAILNAYEVSDQGVGGPHLIDLKLM